MYLSEFKSTTLSATLIAGIVALSGCSTQEDVRITFCKNLTSALVSAPDEIEWREPRTKIKEPEYAAITVDFDTNGANTSATCFYAYDLMHETAMDHANPLLAYATLPYEMTVNGEPVSKSLLTKITGDEQIRHGKVALERVKQVANEAKETLSEGIGETARVVKENVGNAMNTVKRKVDEAKQGLQDRQ